MFIAIIFSIFAVCKAFLLFMSKMHNFTVLGLNNVMKLL